MTDVEISTQAKTRVRATEPAFLEILEFLTEEAAMLDHDQHLEWLELLTDDISYRMPVRETRYRQDGDDGNPGMSYFRDDRWSLGLRARRNVEFEYAYDRDPAPRVRRLVTNLLVWQGDGADEYEAQSYIMLLKNRFNNPSYDLLSAERHDVIRRTPEGLRLARRDIIVDMQLLSTLSWTNVFL
jgi:3-phenylpropionate/cinnamic acid dioxygenase small subunit